MIHKKKAQIWYIDFMIGLMIFFIAVFIYYQYAYSFNQDPNDVLSDLVMETKTISSSLITQGSPNDWNQTNVQIIGLTDGNHRFVQNKLEIFENFSYNDSKEILRTHYDYYIQLKELNGSTILINGEEGIGLIQSNSSDHQIAITRIGVYNSRLISMVVQVWH